MRRELHEETSLLIESLNIQAIGKFQLVDRTGETVWFLSYHSIIKTANFDVYEGSGAEVYDVTEALRRNDLVPATHQALSKLGESK